MLNASRHFQPGDPSRGLLRDCTTSPINRFAALVRIFSVVTPAPAQPRQLATAVLIKRHIAEIQPEREREYAAWRRWYSAFEKRVGL